MQRTWLLVYAMLAISFFSSCCAPLAHCRSNDYLAYVQPISKRCIRPTYTHHPFRLFECLQKAMLTFHCCVGKQSTASQVIATTQALKRYSQTVVNSVKRPYYHLQSNGSFILQETMPPKTQLFEDWDSILVEEMESWNATSNSAEKIVKRYRKLTRAEELDKRIMQVRQFSQEEEFLRSPKSLPRLWIVRPKKGAYCELMKKDMPRLKSLVHRIRQRYTPEQLEIVNVTMDVNMPLCEVFYSGPIAEEIRIFYARGGTLQANCVGRFWSKCDILNKDERLYRKYGGEGCPGLFPKWDEEGIIEELDDCMQPMSAQALRTQLYWGLNNPGALTPENEEERGWWYQNVHWPTRQAVQRAFENGIEDYRIVIEKEYEELKALDHQANAQPTEA